MILQRQPLAPDGTAAPRAPTGGAVVAFRPHAVPLAMPDQRLDAPFRDSAAPGAVSPGATRLLRAAVLALPMLPAAAIGWLTLAWLTHDHGPHPAGTVLAVMTAFALYWVALPVATALVGAIAPPRPAPRNPGPPLTVAILLPMYGEPAGDTILPAVALLQALADAPRGHRFCLRVLSDTRDDARAAAEAQVVQAAAGRYPGLDITWRRRVVNRDFKSGNLRDWIRAEGHRHDAVLVLDADSRMGASTVLRLADELAADPATALIQTVARVAAGRTVWQRLQAFGSEVYGRNLGRGFACWTGAEGNYLGHNAIVRTAAFARCAGLPHLPGRAPRGGVILSHDFVEAALLRRAGWGVRMLPEADESFEEAPETLAGYVRRDRRWCQGNLQHLRLLARPGFHPVSRLHFLQGAMAYLASVWWLGLLVLYAATAAGSRMSGPVPAVPQVALAAAVAALLVGPKVIGLALHLWRHGRPGRGFAATLAAEVVLSVLLAPLLMVQQSLAVFSTLAGRDGGWVPHGAGRPGMAALLRLHRTETALGVLLLGLIGAGLVTPWLAQVAVCLALSAPLSWLVQRDAPRWLGPPDAQAMT